MTESEQQIISETAIETPTKSLLPDDNSGVYLSMNEASRQSKVPKGTISKDVAKGKLQWHERPDGTRKLHAAEVFHFYSDRIRREETGNSTVNGVSVSAPEQPSEQETPTKTAIELVEARTEVRFLRERLANDAEQIKDLREQRNKLMESNQRLTYLLTGPAAAPAAEAAKEEPASLVSFWQRLFPRKN